MREFSRIHNISPPTASKELENLHNLNILKKEIDRQYIYYYANKESDIFVDLSRIYWKILLKPLLDVLEKELLNPVVMLFGSASKAEITPNSDLDLAIFTSSTKKIDLSKFEKELEKTIQIFMFKKLEETDLHRNILNGYKLMGEF